MRQNHRKLVKHFHNPGDVHELTFSCYQRRQLLVDDSLLSMLSQAVDRACERHRFGLVAYVFMPEHVHLLVMPLQETSSVSNLLRAIKRPYSFRAKKWLAEHDPELLGSLTIRQRPGVMTFRFWQEGPGYDRNITELSTLRATIDYIHNNPVKRGLCTRAVEWKWSSAERLLLDRDLSTLPRLCRLE